jgi:thiosulfate/3-mercaptopyruvate sulfurtransferase
VEPLVDVTALARSLAADPPAVLLDVRWWPGRRPGPDGPPGLVAYRAGHGPGAVFVDLDRDLAAAPGPGGRHPLPEAAAFQQAMRRAGVSDGRDVVVYDDADATAAARGWWLLRYFGHTRVRVADGGYRAWVAAGHPVATGEEAAPGPGDFTARPGGMPLLDADGAAELARRGILLDARAAERYRGDTEPFDPVAGHIPGAVSAPTAANVLGNGLFLPAAALRARFGALGLTAEAHDQGGGGSVSGAAATVGVGAYCGSGVTAAHEVLALAVAGRPAALYVGSWSNWVTDPARPVATGPEPG